MEREDLNALTVAQPKEDPKSEGLKTALLEEASQASEGAIDGAGTDHIAGVKDSTDDKMDVDEEVNPQKVEVPSVEPPKLELPSVEPPEVEPPRVETPKFEPPALEPPRFDPPSTEPPKFEPPPPCGQKTNGENTADHSEDRACDEEGKDEKMKGAEIEVDSPSDSRPRLSASVAFLPSDATLNVQQSVGGNILMCLNEGGLQHLLAGARCNVGIKSGRYMFEVKVIEHPIADSCAPNLRLALPRPLLRIGLSLEGTIPLIGDSDGSACFDTEGNYIAYKVKLCVADRCFKESTIAVLVNLDEASPNANTISLFKDGVRISEPQKLPEALHGKALFPTVTYRGVSLYVNFGRQPLAALPFQCRMVADASDADVLVVEEVPLAEHGRYEVLFPICLPDEGTFDWLDYFLSRSKRKYTEISDRMICDWAIRSGLTPRNQASGTSSNDRPELIFGVTSLEDGTAKSILSTVACMQRRHLVVMEVKSNLLQSERKALVRRFAGPGLRRVAKVLVGCPDEEFKMGSYEPLLIERQEALNSAFQRRQQERDSKRAAVETRSVERRAREEQREVRESLRAKRRKLSAEEKPKAEAEEKEGEDGKENAPAAQEAALDADARKKEAFDEALQAAEAEDDRRAALEDEKEAARDQKLLAALAAEEAQDLERGPGKAVLTEEEEGRCYQQPGKTPDVSSYQLSNHFVKFSLPGGDEGFDEIQYEWGSMAASQEYVKSWILDRKLTTRIEELQPGDWFKQKLSEWQKDISCWHQKHSELKDPKRSAPAFAKAASPSAKSASVADQVKPAEDKNDEVEEEPDPLKELEEYMDKKDFDVFDIDDVCDVDSDGVATGSGELLFAQFSFEDWALLALRFELHLLAHAFLRDCKDPDRLGIRLEHVSFYYARYFRKAFNTKDYGVDRIEDLCHMIRDTIVVDKRFRIIESQLSAELDSNGIFVKLTEEGRRERQSRIDSGDKSGELNFPARSLPQAAGIVTGHSQAGIVVPTAGGTGTITIPGAGHHRNARGQSSVLTPGPVAGQFPLQAPASQARQLLLQRNAPTWGGGCGGCAGDSAAQGGWGGQWKPRTSGPGANAQQHRGLMAQPQGYGVQQRGYTRPHNAWAGW